MTRSAQAQAQALPYYPLLTYPLRNLIGEKFLVAQPFRAMVDWETDRVRGLARKVTNQLGAVMPAKGTLASDLTRDALDLRSATKKILEEILFQGAASSDYNGMLPGNMLEYLCLKAFLSLQEVLCPVWAGSSINVRTRLRSTNIQDQIMKQLCYEQTTPHKYISRLMAAMSGIYDEVGRDNPDYFSKGNPFNFMAEKELKYFGDRIAATAPVARVAILTGKAEILRAYQASTATSCMAHSHDHYGLQPHEHPTNFYGNSKDGKFGLLVAYRGSQIMARAVANTETRKYGRVFGDPSYMLSCLELDNNDNPDEERWEQVHGALEGLEFWLVESVFTGWGQSLKYIAPYIDRGLAASDGSAAIHLMYDNGRPYGKVLCGDSGMREAVSSLGGLVYVDEKILEVRQLVALTKLCYETGTITFERANPMVWCKEEQRLIDLMSAQWVPESSTYTLHC